jgi:hypothetical protein
MLLMSLRPPKGAVGEKTSRACGGCSRGKQTAELTLRTIPIDGTSAEEAEPAVELGTDAGVARPRERKSRTWSI